MERVVLLRDCAEGAPDGPSVAESCFLPLDVMSIPVGHSSHFSMGPSTWLSAGRQCLFRGSRRRSWGYSSVAESQQQPMGTKMVAQWQLKKGVSASFNRPELKACPGMKALVRQLLKMGCLAVLQWLEANSCPWDESTCAHTACWEHLNIFR